MKPASISALQDEWPAPSGLLDDALALSPGERDAWLAGLDGLPGLPGISAQHRKTLRALLATQAEIETGDPWSNCRRCRPSRRRMPAPHRARSSSLTS